MPAYMTHYACGVCGFRSLPKGKLKDVIRANRHVYFMGLAGPDIFFYSVREALHPEMTVGRAMHKYRTGAFLRELISRAMAMPGNERGAAIAYAAGFLGHYALDCAAHPLVYRVSQDASESKALGRHFRYEAAMDVYSCRHILGRDIAQSEQMGKIRLSGKERRLIAQLLGEAATAVYPEMGSHLRPGHLRALLAEYYLLSGLLIDPSGFREWIVLHLEQKIIGYPLTSPLMINGNTYSLTEEDWERFRIRFDRGTDWLRGALRLLDGALEASGAQEKAILYEEAPGELSRGESSGNKALQQKEQELMNYIGNRSYHTGKAADRENGIPGFTRGMYGK